jgi:hypothetical protein
MAAEMVYMPALGASGVPKATGNSKSDGLRAVRVIEFEYVAGARFVDPACAMLAYAIDLQILSL